MEEWVGRAWDNLLRRATRRGYAHAQVTLHDMQPVLGPYFRALGGDAALALKSGSAQAHGARRRWLERIAGANERLDRVWYDSEALYLPLTLDVLPSSQLNRELYLWLTTLAAFSVPDKGTAHWQRNVQATRRVLESLPGWRTRYLQLVQACLALRPRVGALPADEAAQEQALQAQLLQPECAIAIPAARRAHWPVPLWLHFDATAKPNVAAPAASAEHDAQSAQRSDDESQRRFAARRVELPEAKNGMLLPFRAESVLTWSEYVRVNRPSDEDDDTDNALLRANDMNALSVARHGKSVRSRVRFDLDLPAADNDDTPLGPGIHVPEWDWRKQQLLPAFCCVEPLLSCADELPALPSTLRAMAARLRRQFEALTPQPAWRGRALQGEEIDLDACLRFAADRRAGTVPEPGLWRERIAANRSLACLLLADLSLSTDTWVGERRVIDVIRDSLFLFAEAMAATRDAFGLYGFSSVKRQHVRFHVLKDFSERYDAITRGRINAIKPGFYTRMGAAIRHATTILQQQPAQQRLLLMLTDGKPNDVDHYEGRYGIEDTRHAVHAARAQGITVFCVTIDRDAANYLPHMFGVQGCIVLQDANQLPQLLPRLYVQLTRP